MPGILSGFPTQNDNSLRTLINTFAGFFLILALSGSHVTSAAEVSLGNGFYQSETFAGGYSKSRIGLGGQYSKQFHSVMYWQAGGDLAVISQSAHPNIGASNLTGLKLNGGLRYYFDRLSSSFAPYAVAQLSLENNWGDILVNPTRVEEKSSSGIFYSSAFGLRMTLSSKFFLDISSELFKSPLFAMETTTVKVENSSTESKTKSTSLYVNTRSSLSKLEIAIGMRL